jgi:hypothetical protein
MDSRDTLELLHIHRKDLLHQILGTGLFRPGTMAQQYRKCGKPNCHCAREGDPGHGPTWILTRKVHSKTVSKAIPLSELQATKDQIATYHQFQDAIHELMETNVRICDALLEPQPEETTEVRTAAAAGKGGSERNSARQS